VTKNSDTRVSLYRKIASVFVALMVSFQSLFFRKLGTTSTSCDKGNTVQGSLKPKPFNMFGGSQLSVDKLNDIDVHINELPSAEKSAVDKHRLVEEALRESEKRLRHVIDALPLWVGARNRAGKFVFANTAMSSFFQMTPEKIQGLSIAQIERQACLPLAEIQKLEQSVIDNKSPACVVAETWKDADGQTRQMLTHLLPLEMEGETLALVVSSDVTELRMAEAQMELMSHYDDLTGLPNRPFLVKNLGKELHKASEFGYLGALLLVDLDQFKIVNESLGRNVGDALLRCVAQRIKDVVRSDDIVVRLGADEFAVLMPYVHNSLAQAFSLVEEVAQTIRAKITEYFTYEEIELRVSATIGVVLFPEAEAGPQEILQYAGITVSQQKEVGREGIKFFNRYMADNSKNVFLLEGDLRKALEEKHFELHFQPRVNVKTKRIVGAEALIRWQHPEKGLIFPEAFISVLESSDMIIDVGMWVLDAAFRNIRCWMDDDVWLPHMSLGVNISTRQFKSPKFIGEVLKASKRYDVPLSAIEMEITEGVAVEDINQTISIISQLSEKGVRFALDDFGTGYSSISYLKQLPISVLKIDQSFVKDIHVDRNDRVLVRTITAMGNLLGLDVVAEGVETEHQLALLKSYGCGYYQGFLASHPLTGEALEKKLRAEPEVIV